MLQYDQGLARLKDVLNRHHTAEPFDDSSKYWHRWEGLKGAVAVSTESKVRTRDAMRIYVSFDTGQPSAPAWGVYRASGESHTSSPGRRIQTSPHHLFQAKTEQQLDDVLKCIDSL